MVPKELTVEIPPLLTLIFQTFYYRISSYILSENKCLAYFQNRSKYVASNNRPVSLTCIALKLMEHILISIMMKHAHSQHILYHLHHGFRSRLSCETNLIPCIHVSRLVHKLIIVMDFSKTFDKVSHNQLIYKLHRCGIQGRTNSWIRSCLSNRTMEFHPQTCQLMPITKNRDIIDNKYMIHGQILETISQAKYLNIHRHT